MDIDREKEGKCLTVTVPCYNSESYLERCVESLLKERDGLEIILVDDGSTDRTGQLADQYARAYPDVVRVVHKKNGGHGSGVNAGLMLANGIYFKVVDSDDWLDEAAFHKLMSVLHLYADPKPGVTEAVEMLREKGIKIGSTTGYTDKMMEIVVPAAASKGYEPDVWFSPDSTGQKGRPYPYMIFRNMEALNLMDVRRVIKVGDTVSDIREGKKQAYCLREL